MIHDKLDGLMTPVEKIARVANAGLIAATAPQTAPSGAISLDNADGTRTIIGEVVNGESNPSYTMATHVGDTTPPGIPTGITATSKSGVVVVEWDGTLSGGIPDDFFCVRVYLDNVELGALTEAGSVASAKLDGGTTVSITATSEDDCCLPDGTPDHNVSQASQAISITVAASAAEIIVDVEDEIDGVRQEIADFKTEVEADYYTAEEVDEQTQAITREVGAVYRDSMARNLGPFYDRDFEDVRGESNPDGYWLSTPTRTTRLDDGWAHIVMDNSAGTGTMYAYMRVALDAMPVVDGTLLVEVRNLVADVTQASGHRLWFNPQTGKTTNTQVYGSSTQWWWEDDARHFPIKANDAETVNRWCDMWFAINKGHSAEFDARISFYEGEYDGKYKQYNADTANLTREYATKTWTEQTAEDYSIGAAQRYTATIANPNLAPYMEHPLTDVWDADTNPGGYWRKSDVSSQLTVEQLEDGWERVTCPGATAWRYSYHRPMPQSWVKPGQTYTMLVEIRNASVTGAVKFTANRANYAAAKSQFTPLRERAIADGAYRFQLTALDDFADCISFTDTFSQWPPESQGSFEVRLSIYENAIGSDGNPIPYEGPWKPYVTGQDALSKEYATQSQLKVGIEGISLEVSEKYATKAVGAPNLNPFFAHDFLDIYNATTNPGGWWRGTVQRDFATQLQDGWARVVIDNTSGTATLARAFRFGATPNLKDGGKYTCLVEMRNILSKPTSETIYTQQGTDVQFWGDHKYDGWTVYWNQVEGDTHVEYKQMKRVEAVSRQTTGTCCFSMNVQVPAGQKADFEIRLSLFENATDSEGENLPYEGTYKPYVTDQQALGTTYTAKTTFEQTTQGFDSRISQNADNIAGEVLARETLIRQYANGVLVCKVGESVGALVNASGSFDVVAVTWSGNNPTVSGTVASLSDDTVSLLSDYARMYVDSESEDFVIASNNSVTLRSNGGSCDLGSYSYEEHGGQTYSEGVGMNMHDEMIEALLWDEYAGTECEFYATSGHGLFINKIAAAPVELFSGNTTGTVTLSELAAYFDRFVIYYESGGSGSGSVEVSSPNGKTFSMQGMYFASSANIVQQRFKVMSIAGASITRVSSGYINTSASGAVSVNTTENNIAVVRVLGYRKYPR